MSINSFQFESPSAKHSGVSAAPSIPGFMEDADYEVEANSPSELQCQATDISEFISTTLTWWKHGSGEAPEYIQSGNVFTPGGILPLDYTFTRDDQDVVFYCVAQPYDTSCVTNLESARLTMDVLRE